MKYLLSLLVSFFMIMSVQATDWNEPYELDLSFSKPEDLHVLRNYSEITSLTLVRSTITSLDEVISLTQLTRLNLMDCYGVLFDLPKLTALQNLQELNLTGVYSDFFFEDIDSREVPSLEFLTELPNLRILRLAVSLLPIDMEPTLRIESLKSLCVTNCPALINFTPTAYRQDVIIQQDDPHPEYIMGLKVHYKK